jgi:uncharacterized sulfatase
VGKILRDLANDGLAEKTIVFFWSDHGRGLSRGKRWLYDSGTHVPLIVRWPGKLPAGEVREELVSLLDLAPTVLSLAGVEIPAHFQGVPFLGPAAQPREYVYGIRDRMDETIDMLRSVRDKRYKYIRNYMPERPYAQPIAYMDEMPTMREWRRLASEGKLVGPQQLFFAPRKPLEELYDTENDPHEIQNLADDPQHAHTLARLRRAHEEWSIATGDVGLTPEVEHMERVRPGGKWSVTSSPVVELRDGKAHAICDTAGASLAYQKVGPATQKKSWQLYTAPVELAAGEKIRVQAFRLGFKESEIVTGP